MKKITVVLAVLLLLALTQVSQAVELQSDWYVKLGLVALFGTEQGVGLWGIDWNFTSPLGTTGPFEVTQPDPLWPQRMISIPNAVSVPSGTAVYLYGEPEITLPSPATDLAITHETNYDSSHLIAQLYVQHSNGSTELLWAETRSDHHLGTNSVLSSEQVILPTDIIYFKVTAVPEPSQFIALLLPTLGTLIMRRKVQR